MTLGGKFLARAPDLLYPTCPGWGFLSSVSTVMSYIILAFVACLALLLLLSRKLRKKFLSSVSAVMSHIILAFLACYALLVVLSCKLRKKDVIYDGWKMTPFRKLDFAEEDILENMKHSDVIGKGGSGNVYRVRLNSSRTVAVKELHMMKQLDEVRIKDKLFHAEVTTLGNIRHRNIVALLCSITCTSTTMLVYEDMQNGSLDRWLHKPRGRLDWPSRLSIAIDTARGLSYMHDQGIIHRDFKFSNILLDRDFGAKIGDFGLARVLAEPGESEPASVVCGTPGHIAPEYLRNAEVSEMADVYSFGVVVLELITGQKPHNAGTEPGTTLARWASQEYRRNKVVWEDIIDKDIQNPAFLEDMKAVFKLGLSCTSEDPLDRPAMNEILQDLSRYDRSRVKRRGKKRTTEWFGAKFYMNIRDKIFRRG